MARAESCRLLRECQYGYTGAVASFFGIASLGKRLGGSLHSLHCSCMALSHFPVCTGKLRAGETASPRGQERECTRSAFALEGTSILGWDERLAVFRHGSRAHTRLFLHIEHEKAQPAGNPAYE